MINLSTMSASKAWKVDATGILDSRFLPDENFSALWDAVIVDNDLKGELLAQGVLNFTLRPYVDRSLIPMHGIIVLVGPPGTGKTSLARGLASRIAEAIQGAGSFRYLEVEPHTLASAALGRSQKSIVELFGQTIAEYANSPLIVLLDEVETLAASRSRMSLESNPIDVHRATDAILAQLDHLATRFPNLLFIATSNFPEAIDAALLSRADLVRTVGLPTPEARQMILRSSIDALAKAFPGIAETHTNKTILEAAKACEGLDGRQIRKVVIAACARRRETALDPTRLLPDDILAAAHAARQGQTANIGDVR